MNFETTSVSEIADYIESHYHEGLRRLLPEVLTLADKVEQVHKSHAACPKGLYQLLSQLWMELQMHMEKEERVLFPLIRAGHSSHASVPIRVMMMEHQYHSHDLERLEILKEQNPIPEDACGTWKLLFAKLEEFEKELKEHIQLENEVLFARTLTSAN